jgi:hypothetical protein
MTASLEDVLAYRHDGVTTRFRTLWQVDEAEAEQLFADVRRWLWLASRNREVGLVITEPLEMMDEMWHEFILFTRDYTGFCERLGGYLHHQPATPTQKRADPAALEIQLRAQVTRVFHELGADVAVRWYREYPARYARAQRARLRRLDTPTRP